MSTHGQLGNDNVIFSNFVEEIFDFFQSLKLWTQQNEFESLTGNRYSKIGEDSNLVFFKFYVSGRTSDGKISTGV